MTNFENDPEMQERASQVLRFRVGGEMYEDLASAFRASTPDGSLAPLPIYFGTIVSDEKNNKFFFVHRVITQAFIDYPTMPQTQK